MVQEAQKTTLQCMERVIRKKEIMEIDRGVAMDLVGLLGKNTIGTFVGLLRDITGVCWGKRVDDGVRMEFLKYWYLVGGMCLR